MKISLLRKNLKIVKQVSKKEGLTSALTDAKMQVQTRFNCARQLAIYVSEQNMKNRTAIAVFLTDLPELALKHNIRGLMKGEMGRILKVKI